MAAPANDKKILIALIIVVELASWLAWGLLNTAAVTKVMEEHRSYVYLQQPTARRQRGIRQRRRRLQPAARRAFRCRCRPPRGRRTHCRRSAVQEQGDLGPSEIMIPRLSSAGQLGEQGKANVCRAGFAIPPSAEVVTGRFALRFPEPRTTVQEQGDPDPYQLV